MDFVRFLHPQLLGLLGFVLLTIIVSNRIKKVDGANVKLVNQIRNWILVISLGCVAWFAFSAATINEVPRKVIDRSVANDRLDTLKGESSKALEDFKKKEGK